LAESSFLCRFCVESVNVFVLPRFDVCTSDIFVIYKQFAHVQTISRMSSLSGRMNIGRVNIELSLGWKKIKQRRISFSLGYLRMILWKISTTIYLYGFLNQSLSLILDNICLKLKYRMCAFKSSNVVYVE
jgi:hypothetical protein